MTIDPETYRAILTNFPSGVAIVTAFGKDDRPFGLTVSAFCAVSIDPPLVLVCIDKESNSLLAIQHAGAFTVNLLAAGRDQLAVRFASKADDKFSDLKWEASPVEGAGPVLIDDHVSFASCSVHSAIEAGDHWIFVGRVEAGEARESESPLVYARQQYADWDDLSE